MTPEWTYWVITGLTGFCALLAGFSIGTRWHLHDLREHLAWLETYTADVNKLLDHDGLLQRQPHPSDD
jgi:hypothetical protein